ncbi:MAG TPA: alpha/beta fold hydrolase, partial [Pyrinomonadaceae bacterium]|nr:alpha/beta fold hydrolase [Pyrinomonadaceae bacterium]
DDGSIVATAAGAVGARELRAHLAERLPDYMIPAHYVWLESLPLTPNGKVDRKALPAPETTLRAEAGEQLVVAPRNEEELRLAEIWEEVLHRQPIDMTDNFFELGGHSLLAVQLFALIEERLHRKLPVAYLFKHSTIEHLAAQLRQHDSTPQSLLVKIQSGLRERQPLFLIHPVGGSVFCYVELARALGREQPLYAFQARGLNGEEAPHASIEEMSGAYLEELRRAQPEGPYLLGGWSMGGVVAFEMAQQLRAAGEEVSMLAMFDSYAPSALTFDSETDNALSLLTQFAIDLGLSTASLALPREQFLQLSASEQLSVVLDLAVGEHLLPAETGLARLHDRFSIFKNNLRAFRNYVPRPYNGRIALFAARDGATESAGKMRGWNKLAPRSVELYEVPGNHYTLLRQPHVTHIAARLTESLPDSEPVFQERGL